VNSKSSTTYQENGSTGLWFDDSDIARSWRLFEYNAQGMLKTEKRFNGNDILLSRKTYLYDDVDRINRTTLVSTDNAGGEFIDTIEQYNYLNGTGLLDNVTNTLYDPGSVISQVFRVQYNYDLNSGRLKTTSYVEAGIDNNIDTANDNVTIFVAEH